MKRQGLRCEAGGSLLLISGDNIAVQKIGPDSRRSSNKAQRLPTLREVERDHIKKVLAHVDYNRTRAAELLGIDRVSLWRKIKQYEAAGCLED